MATTVGRTRPPRPRRASGRACAIVSRADQPRPAEGPVRPLADHHHRAGRAAAGAGRLRLHGAPLAIGDGAAVGGGGRRHRRDRRSARRLSAGRRHRRRSPASPASAWASTSPCCRPSRCPPSARSRSSRRSTACSARRSARQIGKPFWIDTVGRSNLIEIRIQLDDNVLRVFAPRAQAYISNSLIFIWWMVATSVVLLAIAIVFLRNQIRPILR